MSKVSTLQKLGVAARVASRQAGRSRTFNALLSGVRTTWQSMTSVVHQLWLEVAGTVFLAMAAFGGTALIREYMKYQAGHATAGRLAVAAAFTLMFAWFGLSSFWRVRRNRQRP